MLDQVMPDGVEPLLLFRTLATSARLFPRFMRAGVLDRGPLSLRDREIAILRTTARCGAEYEWGVHVSAFAASARLSDAEVARTAAVPLEPHAWSPHEGLVLELMDALHDRSTIDASLWQRLTAELTMDQVLALIYISGFYHLVSFLANGLALPHGPFARRFPSTHRSADAG